MIVLDTSVVIAAFAPWHESHALALATLERGPMISAHTALEAYSVLTRLPDPFRAEPAVAARFLSLTFSGTYLTLDAGDATRVPAELSELGVAGGAAYDGLIALTVRHVQAELLTLDRRAAETYARCGVAARLLTAA